MTLYNMLSKEDLLSFYRAQVEPSSSCISKSLEILIQSAGSTASTPASFVSSEVDHNSGESLLIDQSQNSAYKRWQLNKSNGKPQLYAARSDGPANFVDVEEQLCFSNTRPQDSPKFSLHELQKTDDKDQLDCIPPNPSVAYSHAGDGDQLVAESATMRQLIARLRRNLTGQTGSCFKAPSGTHLSEPSIVGTGFTTSNALQQDYNPAQPSLTDSTFRLPLLTEKDFPFLINHQPSMTEGGRHIGAEKEQFVPANSGSKAQSLSYSPQNKNYVYSSNPDFPTNKLVKTEVIKVLFEDEGNVHSSLQTHQPDFFMGYNQSSLMEITQSALSNQAVVHNALRAGEFDPKSLFNPQQPNKFRTFAAAFNEIDGFYVKKQKNLNSEATRQPWNPIMLENDRASGSIPESLHNRFGVLESTLADVNTVAERSSSGNSETLNSKLIRDIPKLPQEPHKQDFIHVRARRGQATDSHSLAERVRREKISERMKFLQDLVPNCSKVTGKAMILDEIINYVQSLQHQVEFLSMKLAALNPKVEMDLDYLLEMQATQSPRHNTTDITALLQEANYNSKFDQMQCSQEGLPAINLAEAANCIRESSLPLKDN